jgi:hypothetical protein
LIDFGPLPGGTDIDETIHYGNPFATAGAPWLDFAAVVYAMPVVIPHVGAIHALVVQASPIATDTELAPALSPVRAVRIAGQPDRSAGITGVGAAPAIAWDPPATGTATTYAVTVNAIAPDGAGFTITPIGTWLTTATSLALPAFATANATSYVLTITAISAPGRDLAAKPLLGTLPYASADYVTAQITP